MQISTRCLLLFTLIGGSVASRGVAQTPPPAVPKAPAVVMLSGCIGADPRNAGLFTLSDSDQPGTYRFTGVDLHKYIGRRVQISAVPPKRFRVAGGLYPTPNVAAQAGAIDPGKAAIAAAEAGPTGQPVSELRVKSVRTVTGPCQ